MKATGGALFGALGISAALLMVEGWLVARRGFLPSSSAPVIDGDYRKIPVTDSDPLARLRPRTGETAPPLRLALLGDSTGAGVGADEGSNTVGGWMANLLANDRMVRLTALAVAGSASTDLSPQVSRALLGRPDVAVIVVGSDDAIRLVPLFAVRRDLTTAVQRLRKMGVHVVVGTCPDLGAVRAFPQPLRALLGWRGRKVAEAQIASVQAAGGIPVDLAALTGDIFRADRGVFSTDGFHPGPDGYRLWAEALLPAVRLAVAAEAAT